MNKFLYILLLGHFALFGISCTKYDQQMEIADLKKQQTIILHKKANQENIVSMAMCIYGRVDGEAQISLILNGKPYKTEKIKGKVNIKWGGDWYSDSMELRYEPQIVNSGEIKIEYIFNAI